MNFNIELSFDRQLCHALELACVLYLDACIYWLMGFLQLQDYTDTILLQVTMPQSNVLILTDPASMLPVHRNKVTLYPIQGEYSRDKLMLQRIRSYIVRVHYID